MSEQVTVEQLIVAHNRLARIVALPLPPHVSYRLTKISRFLGEEAKCFDAARNPLIERHGESDGSGGYRIGIVSPGWRAYAAELSKIAAEPVEFPFARLDVNDIPSITAEEIAALEFMLTGFAEEADVDAAIAARREQLAKRQGLPAVH